LFHAASFLLRLFAYTLILTYISLDNRREWAACRAEMWRIGTPVSESHLMNKASLLLVDDDRHLLESMSLWLREQGYAVDTAGNVTEAQRALGREKYDLALVDVRLGEEDGFQVLAHAREHRPETAVILLTGYGTVETGIDALRAGAFDLLTKPLIDEELALAIQRALSQRKVIEENRQLKAQLDLRFGLENIVGHDHRMQRVYEMIESVADTRATILITGESGTGKSLIARAIHRRSGRRDLPFVEVACGALPESLLESELFGHVAGAFTGANHDKIGKFKQADTGTIFLDEIGTASPGMQVKLLRVLQELQFEQVGGTKTFHVDTRVILATNEDLTQAVASGKFRQDLFYRINVINIELPALRERAVDIPLLAQHFLDRVCADMGRPAKEFSEDALAAMQRYTWPGKMWWNEPCC
jgi:DNA-binding NtrC family response regulator